MFPSNPSDFYLCDNTIEIAGLLFKCSGDLLLLFTFSVAVAEISVEVSLKIGVLIKSLFKNTTSTVPIVDRAPSKHFNIKFLCIIYFSLVTISF